MPQAPQTDPQDAFATGWRALLAPPYGRRLTVVSAGIALHAFNEIAIAPVMPAALDTLGHPGFLPIVYGLFFASVVAGGLTVAGLRGRFGPRRALLIAALVYVCGVACQSLAPTAHVVLFGRVLQGLADGWIVGLCYSLIGELFPSRLVPRVFSVEAVLWAAAAVAGPLAGGLVADLVHWRAALAVSLPFLALLLAVVGATPAGDQQQRRADTAFRIALPPGLFRLSGTVGRGSWLLLLMTAAQSVSTVYLAYCLHHIFSLASTLVGFVLVTLALTWSLVALPIAGITSTRIRRRILRLAPLFQIAGTMLIAAGLSLAHLPLVVLGQMASGTAFGLTWAIANQAIMDDAQPQHRMRTSALLPTIATAGYVLGGTLAGLGASALGLIEALQPPQTGSRAAVALLWLGAAALAGLALAAAQGMRPRAIDDD